MPRSVESPEGRILRYFREAPRPAALMLLGLIRDQLRMTNPVLQQAPTAAIQQARPAHKRARPKVQAPPPAAPAAPKKSHHKKKPNPHATAESRARKGNSQETEVESFSLP